MGAMMGKGLMNPKRKSYQDQLGDPLDDVEKDNNMGGGGGKFLFFILSLLPIPSILPILTILLTKQLSHIQDRMPRLLKIISV